MSMTTQSGNITEETRRLVNALARDLAATPAGSASRDAGPDIGGRPVPLGTGPTAAAPSSDQDAQRFFGSILQSLVSVVVPKIATGILGLIQQRRRELGVPEERDAERDLQSIFASLLPKLLDAVPAIVSAISGKPAPRGAEEEGERFLPFLAAIIPAVISAVPGIISAFNRQRGADTAQPSISNPEVAERFIGPLLQTILPQILQAAPSILGSIFGGGRDVTMRSTAAW
jgi:hypothetical protein